MNEELNDPHVPSPEFVASLRQEVMRSHRVEQDVAIPRRMHMRRWAAAFGLAAAALVLLTIGLVLGSAAGFASAEPTGVQQAPRSPLAVLKAIPMRDAITVLTGAVSSTSRSDAEVQQGIPVYPLSPTFARTTAPLGAVLGIRTLSDGRVLVNDAGRRQVRLFDSTLAKGLVVVDSTPGTSTSYGSTRAFLLPYLGDSSLFIGLSERSTVVMDRSGQIVRALALPMYEDGVTPFPRQLLGPRGVDDKGRVLTEGGFSVRNGVAADSTLVLRADLDTRQVEVVGARRTASSRNRSDPPENGNRVVTTIRQPVPTEDSWAVLSDGTIAFVRGLDYHVDWVLPDGTKSSTAKLPYDWKRLTDEDKQKLIDSAKVVWDSQMVARNRRVNTPQPSRGDGSGADGSTGQARSSGGAPAPGQMGSTQHMESVPISEIPDFYPPIRQNSAMADGDGNLWILPNTSAQSLHGELVYDVVNPRRGLFMRVRMPVGRSVAGFGKDGVVFLQTGDIANGFHLERAKLDKR